jgi:hypothetical protein
MRTTLLLVCTLSGPALAQAGAWTGYVGGWKYDPPGAVQPLRLPPRAPSWRDQQTSDRTGTDVRAQQLLQQAALVQASALVNQQQLLAQRAEVEREQEALAREQLRAQQALAERERRLADEQLEAQRALLAQQQRLAEQQRTAREQLAAAEALAEKERAQAREQLALREHEALELDRQRTVSAPPPPVEPRTPGPPIHHWVDRDGVEHYSTRPPP